MSKRVYLNVGGQDFSTTTDTLSRCDYFQGLMRIEGDGAFPATTADKPYFIDHDPKGFEHVLNFLRNCDYPFPAEYYWVLPFWGFTVEDTIDREREIKKATALAPTYPMMGLTNRVNEWFEQESNNNFRRGVTMHAMIFHPSTKSTYALDGESFDGLPWSHTLPQERIYRQGWILLPSYLTVADMKKFEVALIITGVTSTFTHGYNLYAAFVNQPVRKSAGWWYIPILSPILISIMPFASCHHTVTIGLSSLEDIRANPSQIRYEASFMEQWELGHVLVAPKDNVFSNIHEHRLVNKRKVSLRGGYLRYLLWSVNKVVPQVTIRGKVDGKQIEQVLSRGDFQYLERERVGLKKLPKGCGAIYYCLNPHEPAQNSGGYQILNNEFELIFPEEVSGWVWQYTFGIFRYRDGDFEEYPT